MPLNCELENPVDISAGTTTPEDFEFSELNCQMEIYDHATSATTGADFYIEKSVGFGEIIIIAFLIIFLIGGIIWFFEDLIIPDFVDFKHH